MQTHHDIDDGGVYYHHSSLGSRFENRHLESHVEQNCVSHLAPVEVSSPSPNLPGASHCPPITAGQGISDSNLHLCGGSGTPPFPFITSTYRDLCPSHGPTLNCAVCSILCNCPAALEDLPVYVHTQHTPSLQGHSCLHWFGNYPNGRRETRILDLALQDICSVSFASRILIPFLADSGRQPSPQNSSCD